MTEDQIVAKLMHFSQLLGLKGHQTIHRIIEAMYVFGHISLPKYTQFKGILRKNWKFGDKTHIKLVKEIEEILTKKGILKNE